MCCFRFYINFAYLVIECDLLTRLGVHGYGRALVPEFVFCFLSCMGFVLEWNGIGMEGMGILWCGSNIGMGWE